MFVSAETGLDMHPGAALARLASLAGGGLPDGGPASGTLAAASESAYRSQLSPPPANSSPLKISLGELVTRGERSALALRWEVEGPGGAPFPTLDADIVLAPGSGGRTLLTVNGVYRPPLGTSPDHAALDHLAGTTIRAFVQLLAVAIAAYEPAAPVSAAPGKAAPGKAVPGKAAHDSAAPESRAPEAGAGRKP